MLSETPMSSGEGARFTLLGGKTALVTGGTMGLGRAIALELARAGAWVAVSQRWGSADRGELDACFAAEGVAPPMVVDADASAPEETRALVRRIAEARGALDFVISNVAFGRATQSLGELKWSTFEIALRYSTWPLVDLVQTIREICGRFPTHVVAVSSLGPESWYPGYDTLAAAKGALDAICRYLALRLRADGVRVNVIKPGVLDTAGSRRIFGRETIGKMRDRRMLTDPSAAARACVALCSGLLDGMTGQCLVVDDGASLMSDLALMAGDDPATRRSSDG